MLAKIQLDAFRTTDLSADFLSALNDRFASLRTLGMKATVLFSYDFSATGQDATAAQIKRHLEQLGPVLAANADVIPYMRAGFIGAWGEWHSSANGNSCGYNSGSTLCDIADANRIIVRDALLANVPETTQIQFRYPSDLQKWYPTAVGPSGVGMHNDCFLSGPTDTGTYIVDSQRAFIQSLTVTGAFGGETCDGELPLRTACSDILTEGREYHLAWLNANYSTTMINAWKAGGCFDQVSSLMGYRLQLDAVSHDELADCGAATAFTVDLRNVGWARLFSARKLVVTLQHKTFEYTLSGSAGDLSTLHEQATASTRVTVNVTIPADAQPGDFDVYLSAPDIHTGTATDPRFAIRFANVDDVSQGQTWDPSTAKFKVGTTLTVTP